MGVSPLMSLGVKAMAANYAALQTTGQNIANANVVGYSRQSAQLATSQGQFTGAGFFGRGVDVTSVARAHSELLVRESAGAKAIAAMDRVRAAQLGRLEAVFKPGEQGLGHASGQFLNAMVDLSVRPADGATRQVVMARAGELASRFNEAGRAIDELQAGVTTELRAAVAEVNMLTEGIAQINQRIAAVRGLGQPPNDMLDERDRLISRLSEHLNVTRVEASDGTVGLFIGGGQRLVLGAQASQLNVLRDPADPTRSNVGVIEGGIERALDYTSLGGGGIAGLLRFQNVDLVDGRNMLGRLAAAIGTAVNQQQQRGLSLNMAPGSTAAAPDLFGLGAVPGLARAHAANQRDVSGQPIGSVSINIVDGAALQASDYELREDTAVPGSYVLTRLRDGVTRAVADGDVVDGFQIAFGPFGPQTGDRFLLQPVGGAASAMRRMLDDPRDLAAASPLTASAVPGNLGTAGVASLHVTAAPLPTPGATARVTFVNDTGAYLWELYDASNNLLATNTGTWSAGQPIPAPPADINGFSLMLNGVPRSGDVLSVEPTPAGSLASNNGNALALMALRDALLVGGLNSTDAYAQALSDVAVRVQGARSSSDISASMAAQASSAQSELSGVNLDEEAARLIQFQQSYQAAAKMLQVAQSLFDTLLQSTGR